MATGIPARLSPAEGRKFGLTLGGAFAVITGLLWWRGRMAGIPYTGGLAAVLILAGLLVPARLGPVFRAWMGLAHLLSKVTTPIFMGVIYYLVLSPIGLVMRAIGRRPLVHPRQALGYWFARGTEGTDAARMERQF